MSRTRWIAALAIVILVLVIFWVRRQGLTESQPTRITGVHIVDAGGRPIETLEVGSTLFVGARRLQPDTMYEFRLGSDRTSVHSLDELVSYARISSDGQGTIRPFALWFQSGVVGCARRVGEDARLSSDTFRTFREAEAALAGRSLRLSVHPLSRDEALHFSERTLSETKAISELRVPLIERRSPIVYPSNQEGCLTNAREAGSHDLYASGENFSPGESIEISVVADQRKWHVNDVVRDVTGVEGSAASIKATADSRGRFSVKVWDRALQRRGVFDIAARRNVQSLQDVPRIQSGDIISFQSESALILFLRYPVGGPTMDIAGRPIGGSPYFEFADSFAEHGDPVWGAVDPTYVPVSHAGGKYAAYYVVAHRDVNGWDPLAGGSTDLIDVSGGIEIMPVKAGCVNGTDIEIWSPPLTLGEYDVVIDFGASPAENQASYTTDSQYNPPIDFLDGADQIGFIVAKDPYELGTFPVGSRDYSQDDYFTSLGGASAVDLRATVRYPATSAGPDTTVAAGSFPLFIIEHGNHQICEVLLPGTGCAQYHTHASCPDRTLNHEGYTRLLEILASHGIIAVSIDAYDLTGNFCQGVQGWIEERGDLILKHLELWSHMNDAGTFTTYPDFFSGDFSGHVDMGKISVSGHSRGGEASVAAYMRNTSFNINSVSSIAPVDFESYVLPDVPYFVILPAADGDVQTLHGVRIYDNAGSTLVPLDASTKSGIYVYGANHNFFNTVWAADLDDYEEWVSASPQRPDYIPAADQQKLGEAYLAAFTRIHLKNELVYEDMLRGRLTFPSTAGRKIYPIRHEKSHARKESGQGTDAQPVGLAATTVNGPSVHVTLALDVAWNSSGQTLTYAIPAANNDVSGFEVLSFRVAQSNATTNPSTGGQDFRIDLFGGGRQKATFASRFGEIPSPYPHGNGAKNVMTTIRIPLHSFIMNRSDVKLDDVEKIVFTFSGDGEVYVDDIEFSR